jgi:hypothetical protein
MDVRSSVCRVLGPGEYAASIKDLMRKEKAGAVCVEITVTKTGAGDPVPTKLPLMLYVHTRAGAHAPYCDESRMIGVRRLSTTRIVRSRSRPGRPTYRSVCSTDPMFRELAHAQSKSRRGGFAPQVASVSVDDEPVATDLGSKIASGLVQRVRVHAPAAERKNKDAGRVCTRCSFYYRYATTPSEPDRSGCYYIYNKGECPHTLAIVASGDAEKLNTATRVSYRALGQYTVTDDDGTVDLARWIYAKFRGTGSSGTGARGKCVSEGPAAPGETERAMRDGSTTLLLHAQRHVPMRELRVKGGRDEDARPARV